MIDIEIIKQISGEKRVLEIVVEKDYVLDWLLWGLSQLEEIRNNCIFKGGTALHKMFFVDWRFSEDLDFTTISPVDEKILKNIIPKICNSIYNENQLRINLKKIESSGNEDEDWSFEIILEYLGPRGQTGKDLPTIKLHITNNEPLLLFPQPKILLQPHQDLTNDFTILTYSLEEILSEKLRTVLHQRCYPKDVYDLWRLLKECLQYVNIPELMTSYNKKTLHRKKIPGIPNDFDERILRLKNQWEQGLKRQIANVPEFEQVYKEIKLVISDLFTEKYKIKGGGLEMLESHYSLKYRKGDFEIEVHGDKSFVEGKFNELMSRNLPTETVKKLPSTVTEPEVGADKKISLAEFLNTKNAKSHGDKILVFGYYLEKQKNYSSFNLDDIEKCYQEARLPETKNFGVYISQLISQGYLMNAPEKKDSKKAWTLTQSGIKYVEETLVL